MEPKATSKAYLFEISKTWNFYDSTMIFMIFWGPGGSPGRLEGKKMNIQGLHMAAQGLQMHHVDVHGVYGRWLPGHQDPRIQVIR